MSFSFGFKNDDISDNEDITCSNQTTSRIDFSAVDQVVTPKIHSADDLLNDKLMNVRITFDNHITCKGNVTYRREIYDIKHQVMTEDGNEELSDLVIGDSDLKKNVYEGGFKSWECSYDTVDEIVENSSQQLHHGNILELGCGTSLPSCQILMKRFEKTPSSLEVQPLNLILADFNYEVLRLVTLPNLIIHWASTLDPVELQKLMTITETQEGVQEGPMLANDEILLTDQLIAKFKQDLADQQINLIFISGSWGPTFIDLVSSYPLNYIISSETIYSLDSLPIVAEILMKLVNGNCRALVAAKDFYFGVGGSVKEFMNYLADHSSLKVDVKPVSSQLKRSLISVYHN